MNHFLLTFSFLVLALSLKGQAEEPNHSLWEPITLSFEGPATSEDDSENPFTTYRLLVRFSQNESEYLIRGYYAADGNAAESSADSGNTWRVHFSPDKPGKWTWQASLRKGSMIAIDDDPDSGEEIELVNSSGCFLVADNAATDRGFYSNGRLTTANGYYRFHNSDTYWLKGGADSPENFLAYADFDGTRRHRVEVREGEADPADSIHSFTPHIQDWNTGDPTWQNGKGKGIIGAINYLASTGMNAVYFLTMNIGGDGKDVWPYLSYDDYSRFDCSKLDQWEILFRHMQRKGVLMHVVLQETENERMLDDGNTGDLRKLYLSELIARFAHNPGLVWNLGEENGPVDFSPHGQNSEQQRAMASYIKSHDPYRHPVVIHTHSTLASKDHLLPPLLNHPPLDGLSFQVDEPTRVHEELVQWRKLSRESGHQWVISMDEIGPWQNGVKHDDDDPTHDHMRHHVLWGSLMGGAAGVEWYFGAHQKGNDLDTEDWRSRANMWEQTRHALTFFETYLPYWEMEPANDLTLAEDDYCFAKPGEIYAIYSPKATDLQLNLQGHPGLFEVIWMNPISGQTSDPAELDKALESGILRLSPSPDAEDHDWVALVRKSRN